MCNMSMSDNKDGVTVALETGSSCNFRQDQDICKFPKTRHVFGVGDSNGRMLTMPLSMYMGKTKMVTETGSSFNLG